MYWVYNIEVHGVVRYIGITNDLKKRQRQHNYLCFSKLKNKKLYNNARALKLTELKIIPKWKIESKREAQLLEAYLILKDFFNDKHLWQELPKSINYFK